MSALSDDISRRHWRLGFSDPSTDVCMCGWRQGRDNGQIGYNRHLVEVTEAAVREQIAAEIESAAECRSWIADSALIQGMREAAEIARGEW